MHFRMCVKFSCRDVVATALQPQLYSFSPSHCNLRSSIFRCPESDPACKKRWTRTSGRSPPHVQAHSSPAGEQQANLETQPVVEHLMAMSGSRQRTLSLVKAHPELVAAPLQTWQIFLETYGISGHAFFRLLSTHPHLFTAVSLFSAGRGMSYLQSLGLSTKEVSQVVCRVPELLLRCDPEHCAPVVRFLQAPLPADSADFGSSSSGGSRGGGNGSESESTTTFDGSSGWSERREEEACGSNSSSTTSTSVQNSQCGDGTGLGLDADEIRCLVARCPAVLLQDAEVQLRPRMRFLLHLGLSPGQAKQLVLASSSLIVRPPEHSLEPPLTFLQQECGMDRQQTAHILAHAPGVAHISEANLERKWSYLCEEVYSQGSGGRLRSRDSAVQAHVGRTCKKQSSSSSAGASNVSQARAAVLAYPRVLEKSLLTDIGPRFSYARDKGLLTKLLDYNNVHGSVMISLGRMLEADNIQFPTLIDNDREGFEQYCRLWKRSSHVQLTVPNAPFAESSW